MIKFPYFNMQQLNLDWLMEHISNMQQIVHVPALAGDDLSDVADMIDLKALEIPKGISFMQAGQLDDPFDRQCMCLIFKNDNDNIITMVFSQSANIGIYGITKTAGVWS